MQNLEIIVPIVIAYVVFSTAIGAWSVKHAKNTSSWMTAKGQMPLFVIGVLMMSEYMATGTILGTAETAFSVGISAAWNVVCLSFGFLIYAFFIAPKFQQLGEYTISGAVSRYGKSTRLAVSFISIYCLIIVNVAAYAGGAVILSTMLSIPIWASVVIIATLSTIVIYFGGIRGVAFSNILHVTMKYAGVFIIAFTAWSMLKGNPTALASIPKSQWSVMTIGVPKIISWTLANIGTIIASQYVIQSIAGVSNPADAKKVSLIASLAILPAGLLSAFVGVAANALFPSIKGINAFTEFVKYLGPVPSGIVYAGLVAVTFVTIMSCQVGMVALLMKDFIIPKFKPTEKNQLLLSRLLTIVAGIIPIPFALFVPGLLKIIFFARTLRTAITTVVLFMFYLPHIGRGKSASIGLGITVVATTIWFFLGNPFGIDTVYVAIVITALTMIGDRIFFGKNEIVNIENEKVV